MQYLPNTKILCLTYDEFVPAIMIKVTYDLNKQRGNIKVHGRGGNGSPVLIEFETLPQKYKLLVEAKFGNPYKYVASQPLLEMVKEDMEARMFYAGYTLPDGRFLPYDYQQKYSRQADWLIMIGTVLADKKQLKEILNISIKEFWQTVFALHQNDKVYKSDLPVSEKRMREKLKVFQTQRYNGLVEAWRFNNDFARKVDARIERLIMSLYCREEKPYFTTVCREYKKFMAGELEIVDLETGEVFDPQTFYVDGSPYEVGEDTVKYYIEKPLNRAVVDKIRMSALEFSSIHRPHYIREAPQYSLSKITMDDICLPFKMPNGERAWSYQVFDVASQAVIGVSFSRDKSQEMIREALRDMFRNILSKGWGVPGQIEVEQHLNSGMKGAVNADGEFVADILTPGTVFPFVRFCAARNPQEKRAEGFINRKKYDFQKQRKGFQHRPFGRKEANRQNEDLKVVTYSYNDIINNELADIEDYNNALHPDQEKYKGLTRWQVLEQNRNPQAVPANIELMLPYVGLRTKTSIQRGYVQVQYRKYKLADINKLAALTSESVIAYYLTDKDGEPAYVHLYEQNGNPICRALPVQAYQEALIERDDQDEEIRSAQAKYIAEWERLVKDKVAGLSDVSVVKAEKAAIIQSGEFANRDMSINNDDFEQKSTGYEGGVGQNNEASKPWYLDADEVKRRANRHL